MKQLPQYHMKSHFTSRKHVKNEFVYATEWQRLSEGGDMRTGAEHLSVRLENRTDQTASATF